MKFNKLTISIVGAILGGAVGFIYWKEIGCLSGTCPIKSQWQTMVPYGLVMGYLLTDIIQSFFQKNQ